MQQISALELKRLIDNQNPPPVLLDVRESWEFALCNIEGSALVPMSQIHQVLNNYQRHQQIVVICHTGIRSRSVCHFLENAGFEDVINLAGGVHAWAMDVDNTMATY